jgi:hypothetical protein
MTREELKAKYPQLHTLEPGTRYIASRPMAERRRTVYPVSIRRVVDSPNKPVGVDVVIDNLTYDEANALLAAFNNGTTSFDGRVW